MRRQLHSGVALLGGLALAGGQTWGAGLPVVCVAGSCGSNAPNSWLGSGQASSSTVGSTLTVQQSTEQAILNWASFNISADGRVIFKQPNSSAIALNRIFQASPSQIFGMLQANGKVYLVNQNGFVFGPSAQVNVGGLLASTLQLSDSTFNAGLLAPLQQTQTPALTAFPNSTPGQIVVQPGAQLSTAADNQLIMLAAPTITNGGSISAPNGQVILAAGQSVYIQGSTDPALRGLVVEVDSAGVQCLVDNLAQGNISVAEGNATLVGLAVNQQGRVSATTSVNENGSIRLLARDTVVVQGVLGAGYESFPSNGGTLTLGAHSVTQVLPDTASTLTAVDSQSQLPSSITLAGQKIDLAGGSLVDAPGGQVSIAASSDPSAAKHSLPADPAAQLRIDSGAVIDVAGSVADVPVTRNLVTVQLRGTELADSPLQRGGPLQGQTVIVDARVGTPLANVSGELALTERSVLERTATGGSIVLDSTGDVVVATGATLNVSGGAVNYTPGLMQTTQLIKPDGSTVDIGSASPNQSYIGIINPSIEEISNQWGVIKYIPTAGIAHYDPGYTQGMSAGSIQVLGSSMILNGNFVGQAQNGIYQRSGSGVAQGGLFEIGLASSTSTPFDYRAPAVDFVSVAPSVSVDPNASLPSDLTAKLPVSLITDGGFSRIQISSNESITVPSGLDLTLAPGGSLTFLAPTITIDSSIKVPSGTIAMTTPSYIPSTGSGLGIFVNDGVQLNVSGMWTNDLLLPPGQTPTGLALSNGGSIQLQQQVVQGTLELGSSVQLLADGGAQLARSGALSGGAGGAIALIASSAGSVQVGNDVALAGFGVQGAKGGSFSLEVPRIEIGSGDSTWLRAQSVDSDSNSSAFFTMDASLFSQFGFSSFTLTADGPNTATGPVEDTIRVLPNTTIDLRTPTLLLNASAANQASGATVESFAAPTLLPAYERTGSQLTLQSGVGQITPAEVGDLSVGANASITADPDSTITLSTYGNLNFNGTITAPAGNVSLQNIAPPAGATFDAGYVPGVHVELGSLADINVAGTTVYQPNDLGLLNGTVLAGGSVALSAARGSVVTDAGSMLDFSGTQALIDLPGAVASAPEQAQMVASAAGSLSLASPLSISLLGSYRGAPGIGTTGRADGGSLSLTLSNATVSSIPGFPNESPTIIVQTGPLLAAVAADSGSAVIDTVKLAGSGVDALTLVSDNAVEFADTAALSLARSVTLTTPALSLMNRAGSASVTAPYIALGSASSNEEAQSALPGAGSLSFSADRVDLIGSLAFQGVANATITSSGEILLRGDLNDPTNLGSVAIAGNLTLQSARVVPTTSVNFTITAEGGYSAVGPSNEVQFEQHGSLSDVPLSVNGALTVNAQSIIQAGTVDAPFGQLTFNAGDSMTFAPGSLTSVSGAGATLPYGTVQNGTSWLYQSSLAQLANTAVATAVTALPARQIALNGAKVTIASGATIDVAGGGDLAAYQWVSDTQGTTDVLSNAVSPGLYAVLPSLKGESAPYDPMMWGDSTIAPNSSVYLSAGSGLAAGIYPLLPARYALLPGAYLVQLAGSGYQDLQPGTHAQAANGYPIVAGYFTAGNTGIGDTRYSGFLVEPGSYTKVLGDYTETSAASFFAGLATNATSPSAPKGVLPADAGTVLISVQQSFNALGQIDGAAGAGGEGATIQIAAPQIEVDPSIAGASTVAGQIHLGSSVLAGWNAGSLWLGAQSAANGSATVLSSSVTIASGSHLTADDIVLAATGAVEIDTGASVITPSLNGGAATPAAATATPTMLSLSGGSAGAAVLALSDLSYWLPARTGTATAPAATLTVASGAQVGSRGALTIDAPGGGSLGDDALSGQGARWSIASTNIDFEPQAPLSAGFALDDALVSALSRAGTVRLSSVNAIGVLQPVNLGTDATASISEIDILAPGFDNEAGAGVSGFRAGLISLMGGLGAASSSSAGLGGLSMSAREIDIGSENFALTGFASTTLDASELILGVGSGVLAVSGNLNLQTPVLTAASDTQTQVAAGGTLTMAASDQPAVAVTPTLQSGGSLSLAGTTITDSTLIAMPSGEVSFSATQQLVLGTGAAINVAGVQPSNAAHGSDGGSIELAASAGDLSVASGVTLSVAAGAGADAGSIAVTAAGVANIQGQLEGSSSPGQRAGSFSLQAGSIVDFIDLNNALEQSGFHESRLIRVTNGNLELPAGSSITAHTVELTADQGAISVAGTIDASSASGGGDITLSAGGDLTLASSAVLSASAIGAGVAGGHIELASVAGSVQLDPAAQVSASGAGATGTLLVRAPLSNTGSDASISSLPADLTHVDSVLLEPILPATLSAAPTVADLNTIYTDIAASISTVGPALLNRLGLNAVANVAVRPYADLTTTGSLTLSSIDFSTWRFAGQPADISVRATGSVTVDGIISDGFSNSAGFLDALAGPSARIALVAGADLGSASATAVVAGTAADLTLMPAAIVRTGSGALTVVAARDVVIGSGASIYTGGVPGAPTDTNTDTGVPLSFPTAGGDIRISAGRDVIGATVPETAVAVDLWNPRFQPNDAGAAIWGIDFGAFQWNVGALGGGNVMISAGRDMVNVTAAVADSRLFAADGTTSIALGGGNLEIQTGRDVVSALLYVGNGIGSIDAGGALSSNLTGTGNAPLGTLLLAGDASFRVSAQRDVLLQGEVSETSLAPDVNSDDIFYFRYDPGSSLAVQSRGGSITYGSNLFDDAYLGVNGAFQSDPGVFEIAAPSMDLAAFGADVVLGNIAVAYPSTNGQLTVYAARDLTGSILGMADVPVSGTSGLPTADSPSQQSGISFLTNGTGLFYSDAGLHANDPIPVQIAAGRDIHDIEIDLPKAADISAGRNIKSLTFAGQNLEPDDITFIRAGGNISQLTTQDSSRHLELGGPGQFEIIAGGSIDLGYSDGITTLGNLSNANLPSSGASVTVVAGLGAPIGVGGSASSTDFLGSVIAGSAAYQTQLVDYVQSESGDSGLSFDAAAQMFRSLPLAQQLPLIEQVYFNELATSGEEANQVPSLGFGRGYAAIDSLFPQSRSANSPYSGDLSLGYSDIYTLDGGSISLLVPGGAINVGLANPPLNLQLAGLSRPASSLGIVAVKAGDVDIYSLNDVLVNQSRIFTLGGGNILIWSTLGNIDAGRGSKTSISAPPPTVEVDASGNVTLDFQNSVVGSGIRTIQSDPSVPYGNVNLIAPVGFVNAGDAGIGAAGNINIAAERVIGASNINFGGTATGVPPAVGNIGVALSGASSAGNSASTASGGGVESAGQASAAEAAPLASAALDWLDVFIEGFGTEVCKADDAECLKRSRKSP